MFSIINNSKSGVMANQDKLNIIGQNIVNSQTNGYKKIDVTFSDLLPDTLNRSSIPRSKELQVGGGVRTTNPLRVFTQGMLKRTGMPTDLAIDGEGLFAVTTPNGETKYTRSGDFDMDSTGKLVDLNGNILNIAFDEGKTYENAGLTRDNLKIMDNGEVYADDTRVGVIKLYTAIGDNAFISEGDSLYGIKEGVEVMESKDYSLLHGYVEMSNVDMLDEMTDMMSTQKAIQFNSKGLQMANDMWGIVNNLQSK